MRRIIILSWIAVLVLARPAAAEHSVEMKETVVSATKSKTPAKQVTKSLSIVQGEGLSESRPLVADALREVPGVFVRRTGQAGRTTSIVLRGASVTQAQVVVDGARVGSPTLGFFDFQFIQPENLERIEVMRGPSSVLYGSEAMAGVVILVTKRGEGPLKASYTQEVGNRNTFRERATAQGGVGNWHFSGSTSRFDTDGVSQNDDYGSSSYSTRIGYDFAPDNTLDFTLNHQLTTLGLDDGAFRPDTNRKDRFRQTLGSIIWDNQITHWWGQVLRFSTEVDNNIDNDPSDGGGAANSLTKLDTERYSTEWRNVFTPVHWDIVTVGFEYDDREADRRTGGANNNISKAQNTKAAYVQNQWNPLEDLTVLTGVRQFDESAFGSGHVFDTSASYFFESLGLKLRGGYGEGFRAPTLNELFFPNFGNANLGPEESRTIECGFDHCLLNGLLSWAMTFHRTNYQDLIQIVQVTPTTFAPVNVGKARVEGIELEAELHPATAWTIKGSYTNNSAHDRATGEELLRIPNNTYSGTVRYVNGKWEARMDGFIVSSREESVSGSNRQKDEGYPKLDLYAAYRFKQWIKGYVRVENVTNRNYIEIVGFPAEGTTGILGFTIEN